VPYFARLGVFATWREANPFEQAVSCKDAKAQSLAKANQGTSLKGKVLDRLKLHRLAFADVSISAWVWIYTCLRISICKR
jgi:hypothetical protein